MLLPLLGTIPLWRGAASAAGEDFICVLLKKRTKTFSTYFSSLMKKSNTRPNVPFGAGGKEIKALRYNARATSPSTKRQANAPALPAGRRVSVA